MLISIDSKARVLLQPQFLATTTQSKILPVIKCKSNYEKKHDSLAEGVCRPPLAMSKCRFSMNAVFIRLSDKGVSAKAESSTIATVTRTVQTVAYFYIFIYELQDNTIYRMLHTKSSNTYLHTTHKLNQLSPYLFSTKSSVILRVMVRKTWHHICTIYYFL